MSARGELVELLAKARCRAEGCDPDRLEVVQDGDGVASGPKWVRYRPDAAALVEGLAGAVGPQGLELIAKAAAVAVAFGKVIAE